MNNFGLVVGVVTIAALLVLWTLGELIARLLKRQRATIQREADSTLQDMFIFVDPTELFYWNAGALFVVPAMLWLLTENPVVVVGSAIGLLILPRWLTKRLKRKRYEKFEKQLPDSLLMISGSMRAGAGVNMAIESMVSETPAPLSQEFELLLREMRVGVDFDTALTNMEARLPIQDFVMVVSAMRIAREVGGNLADILESIADTLRKKHVMEGKINALTAQGKIQGLVMTCLPLFLMGALYKMEPEAMAPLFHTPLGWGVLGVIAVMEVLGYIFIQKIVTIDV